MLNTRMKPWLSYRRVSSVGDREETLRSPEMQQDRIAAYADSHGLEVEMLPPELDVSGGSRERPILSDAIERVERDEAAGIIVAELDRLSRLSLADAHKVIERIESAGGQVIAVAENFDASTPEGEWTRDIFLSRGRMELRRYSERFAAAKRKAVGDGIWPTSVVPPGYRVIPRTNKKSGPLEPDPEKVPTAQSAFEARASGASWKQVGELLGYGPSGARKVVSNRCYLGEIRLVVGGEEIVNPSAHEPIIDRNLFEAAQIAHPRPARNGNAPALLAGIVRCAHCRGLMTPSSKGKGKQERIYRCQSKQTGGCPSPAMISQRLLDPYVTEAVLALIEDGRFTATERVGEVEAAEAALTDAEARRETFLDVLADAGEAAGDASRQLRRLTEAVDDARRTLAHVRAASAVELPVGSIREVWEALSIEERRHLLRGTLPVVFVRRGRRSVAERVRLLTEEPSDLPRPGSGAGRVVGIPWEADLPGEIRPPAAENLS
jgi:DNA invertase Pin-like site-specific DNA recombinase